MSLFTLMLPGAGAVGLMMIVIWYLGVRYHDVSFVDRVWGLGFLLAMSGYLWEIGGVDLRSGLTFACVAIWGLRLSWHLHRRNSGHGEDPRYTAMRNKIGPSFVWKSFLRVNLLQAVILLIVSTPLAVIARGGGDQFPTLFDLIGFSIYVIGLGFEVIGDAQLKVFKANPANRGQVLRSGLWGLTRHPNYFGDSLLWWGFGIVSLSCPGGYWTLIGPALMSFLLRRVSGVTLLEADLVQRKPGYANYIAEVPPFWPRLWPRPRVKE